MSQHCSDNSAGGDAISCFFYLVNRPQLEDDLWVILIQEEIQNGESRTLECKATLPHDSQKWIKTIVSFANGAGGKFVLGVNNQREFVGLSKSVDLFELKDNIADTIGQMCEPQIMFDITAEMVDDAQLWRNFLTVVAMFIMMSLLVLL